MTLDAAIYVVEPLDHDVAEHLDKRIHLLTGTIRDNLVKLYELLQEAKRGNVAAVLGYSSWTAYIADVFTVQIRLEPDQRRELVGYLSGQGMSQRAIANVVGADRETVRRDQAEQVGESGPPGPVIGLDGKTYQRNAPEKPEAHDDTEDDDAPDDNPSLEALHEYVVWVNHAARSLRLAIENADKIDNLDGLEPDVAADYIKRLDECEAQLRAFIDKHTMPVYKPVAYIANGWTTT